MAESWQKTDVLLKRKKMFKTETCKMAIMKKMLWADFIIQINVRELYL